MTAQDKQAQERDWPEDFEHDNGRYMCRCLTCGNIFTGYKRRMTCKLCAADLAEMKQGVLPEQQDPLSGRDEHSPGLAKTIVPRWVNLVAAMSDPLFQALRGVMGTANHGQDDALFRALCHFEAALYAVQPPQDERGQPVALSTLTTGTVEEQRERLKKAHRLCPYATGTDSWASWMIDAIAASAPALQAGQGEAADQIERLDAENHALRQQVKALTREAWTWNQALTANLAEPQQPSRCMTDEQAIRHILSAKEDSQAGKWLHDFTNAIHARAALSPTHERAAPAPEPQKERGSSPERQDPLSRTREDHSPGLAKTIVPRWATLAAAMSDPLFQAIRGVMGTANHGQDDALFRAISHFEAALATPAQPFGYVTKTTTGVQHFYPDAPYLDNAVECVTVYASPSQPVAAEGAGERADVVPLSECRHCGWMCSPNAAPKRAWYPLEQPIAASQDSAKGGKDA